MEAAHLDRPPDVLQRAPQPAPQWPGRDSLRHQPAEPATGDAVVEAEGHPGAPRGELAEAPASPLVDPGDRAPGEVAWRVPLDDLDQAANLCRADPEQHPEAGAGLDLVAGLALPAGEPIH